MSARDVAADDEAAWAALARLCEARAGVAEADMRLLRCASLLELAAHFGVADAHALACIERAWRARQPLPQPPPPPPVLQLPRSISISGARAHRATSALLDGRSSPPRTAAGASHPSRHGAADAEAPRTPDASPIGRGLHRALAGHDDSRNESRNDTTTRSNERSNDRRYSYGRHAAAATPRYAGGALPPPTIAVTAPAEANKRPLRTTSREHDTSAVTAIADGPRDARSRSA